MAHHLHGGRFDPNSPSEYVSYQGGATGAHGGAYTPGNHTSIIPSGYSTPRGYQSPLSISQAPQSTYNQAYEPTPRPQPVTSQHYEMERPAYNGGQPSYQNNGSTGQEAKPAPNVHTTAQASARSTTPPPKNLDKEFPVHLKDWLHIFTSNTSFRWRRVHHYQEPGYVYDVVGGSAAQQPQFRHRDFAGRVCNKPLSDRYLHHHDGYLRKLIVQTTDDIFEGPDTVTWRRTYVRKMAPLKVRIATWVIDFSYDPDSWSDWSIMVARALPAAIAMTLCFWDVESNGTKHFNLWYAPVPYRFHGVAKEWSNHLENRRGLSLPVRNNQAYRQLRPRHLCYLRSPLDPELRGVDVKAVTEWEEPGTEGTAPMADYLFVAYSTEQFVHASAEDMRDLHVIAETACRAARLPAYWIACSCMRDELELESDVYRIADVLRGASRMVIVVGQPRRSPGGAASGNSSPTTVDSLLRQWGSRMWTFPEVLLSPGENITVYWRDGNLYEPVTVAKAQFASRVWARSDAETSRQLVDNFIGKLTLSRLELAVLALKCLYGRDTTAYLDGDQAYALMGLLSMRPQIDKTDTKFQAFARLSLANDSDQLLERYLCTLPANLGQPWYDMEDAYQSQLWDITPTSQVAAICDNDTVVLDGAHGASIRWKSFYSLYYERGFSWKRWFAELGMEWNGFILIFAIVFFSFARSNPAFVLLGIIFLAAFLYFWLMTPRLVRVLLGGKFTQVQAAFFGIEGHLNAPTIERALFGGNFGRMTWSTNGSPLSRSYVNEHGERIGMDPIKDPEVRVKIEAAKSAKPGQMRIFTLVDTYNMEIMLFEAVRPPVCVFLAGSEGGMQRAIACSYDWTTQTMYRETVLRLPTTALNRMDRVPRFRLGFSRPDLPMRPVNATSV